MIAKWAIFDLDGTLCDTEHRNHLARARRWDEFHTLCHLDPPREAEVELVRSWWGSGHYVAIFTGRMEATRKMTEDWLRLHGIGWDILAMREDGDHRPAEVVKLEMYQQHFQGVRPVFAIDDRESTVKFWRSLGLTCFHCQTGEVADGERA